uniref:PRA1 family protein n=1 Tax=Mantoniella antarctica TaxID=81844 RepID=A0A7S0SDP1_9CHLO|eukprot:CAMPEP_0181385626 /NCGR_PEP_ID=MMETSP1106-20121128/22670_1 /TAXON_ID=81844 /ORGANISM="Mantoniella antarctica, Strain SL-175" /LENGTH=218 /DNA_ID=CAMNT_0023505719 /DNA_START=133 /DNA_END=789 /DNA_ORIENTATION=-
MATEGRAKGLAGVSHSLLLQVVASLRALFDRSAPWLTLVDVRKLACPESMGGALHNLRRNANDFGYNYSLLLITVSVACVVTKPFSLITIACLLMLWAYVFYVHAAEVTYKGFTFTLRLQGVILTLFSGFVLFAATNVSQLLMGGVTMGCFLCAGHAMVRTPEALPEDGEKGLMGGFTDFVSTSISSNAAALGKVSDMIPTKWSQQIDGALGKLGVNL